MENKKLAKKLLALLLSICCMLSLVACGTDGGDDETTASTTEAATEETTEKPTEEPTTQKKETVVYFYNSDGWTTVGAYVWGSSPAEALGAWPGTDATPATDMGENWYSVTIPANPSFNVIFFDKDGNPDGNRIDIPIADKEKVYGCLKGAYASQSEVEAEYGAGGGSSSGEVAATVYFLNSGKWANVGAYIYGDKGELLGSWGTTKAEPAEDLGGDWLKVDVTDTPAFSIIFYNVDSDSERAELYLDAADKLYVTAAATAYTSKEDAEASFADTKTTIFFLNNKEMAEVYAYAYADDAPVADAWPGIKATQAVGIGDNWWMVEVNRNAITDPFTVIFSDNGNNQIADVEITNYTNNYVTGNGELFAYQTEAEASVGIKNETTVYYLNSEGWEDIGAYVYGNCGEAFGPWPGIDVVPAEELGGNWVKATVPAKPSFSIIFHDKNDTTESIRAELMISSEQSVYVAGCKKDGNVSAYSSLNEAQLAMGEGDDSQMTTVYYYNIREWKTVNCYVYRMDGETGVTVGTGWPGKPAEEAPEIGENWWKFDVPRVASEDDPFFIIFNNGLAQDPDIEITSPEVVYTSADKVAYATPEDAISAAESVAVTGGGDEGPNEDIDNYDVKFDGEGAVLPYITYEAESADTNAEVLEKDTTYRSSVQTEASGRQAVKMDATGEYVEFTLTEDANSLVLRFNMPDSADGAGINATLSMYIDGEEAQDLELTSKYAWVYGAYPYNNNPNNSMPHRYFDETRVLLDETLPAGTKIRLQKDDADTAEYYIVDFIECELVEDALPQPEGSLSVTDFGAVANDNQDDYQAFVDAIAAAKKENKEVWIPAGRFDLVEKQAIQVVGVTIRGAGMWHTELYGDGAAFKYGGTSKFFDFAMTGVVSVRDDAGDPAAFEGLGQASTNITIQNIWIEHTKVGVWSVSTDRMAIQGCRIRNTYADGINLCSGTNDTVVRNNSIRNTGDDCIAIWPWLADCSGNTIANNTIQVPTLANGVAIYGGGNQIVENNHVMDTINNGAGIVVGSEFSTANGYTGKVSVRNNLLERCGSKQTDENYPIGAIWIWSSFSKMTTEYNVYGNKMIDSSHTGITIECNSNLTGLNIQHNTIDGATDAVYVYLIGTGSAKVGNLTTSNLTGKVINNENSNFIIEEVDEDINEDGSSEDGSTEEPTTAEGAENENDDEDKGGDNFTVIIIVVAVVVVAGIVIFLYVKKSKKKDEAKTDDSDKAEGAGK